MLESITLRMVTLWGWGLMLGNLCGWGWSSRLGTGPVQGGGAVFYISLTLPTLLRGQLLLGTLCFYL